MIVAVGSIGAYSYSVASDQLLNKIRQQQTHVAEATTSTLDYVAKDFNNMFGTMYLSNALRGFLLSTPTYTDLYLLRQTAFHDIDSMIITQDFSMSMAIYPLEGRQIEFTNSGSHSLLPPEQFKRTPYYRTPMVDREKFVWDIETESNRLFYGDNERKVIFSRALKDLNNQLPLAVVVIGFNEKDLRQAYLSEQSAADMETVIVSDQGVVLSSSSGQWLGGRLAELPFMKNGTSPDDTPAVDASRWLYSRAASSQTGWQIYIFHSKASVLSQISHIRSVTLSVIAACILLLLILTWLTASFVTKPINRLLLSMRKLQTGDFTQNVPVTGQDEIGLLARTYNLMVSRIRQLIDDVYKFRLARQEAELRMLQSQINPHFLYNMLDTICWEAERVHQPKIADMTHTLAQVFRLSLNDGRDIIPLHKELQLVRHYLHLQQLRFVNRLHFEIEAEPIVSDRLVPKLMIQPFVENAIIHGIEPLNQDGFLHISVTGTSDGLVIALTDNGVGIPPERLDMLLAAPHDDRPDRADKPRRGYAIWNCMHRLQLYYGDAARIEIESKPGAGTRIHIVIPDKEVYEHVEAASG
ncbi:sensor histidine kinase [Cohnella hashimotonis]|uniref:Sensor histidine kinase n=1 Tax=Cohnella hashimotonis TaxID=2826895 RepID=A0ABT6TGU7_9BACL|nr:sensor histidine kinase [Cohnella hashimotonis]MDI4645159.1 sensor histidine kinase [Cohnella hashimotonis]